jgi:hypothetical protein
MRKNIVDVQHEVENRNRPLSANPKITFTFKDSNDENLIKYENKSQKRYSAFPAIISNHERENQK